MKKKILISIDWFLPGTKSGGPVRSYANLIDHFKDEYEFYIVTRDMDYCETEPYVDIERDTWFCREKNVFVYYISKNNLSKKTLSKVFDSKPFDVILINGMYSWYFSLLPLVILKSKSIKKIVSARGMLNSQAFSTGKSKKKLFIGLASFFGLYKNITFHATNLAEANSIKKEIGKDVTTTVAPNLPRIISGASNTISKQKEKGVVKLISIARIAKEKGTLHSVLALSKINSLDVVIELDLYGALYDKAYWDECKELIAKFPKQIKVNYKGNLDSGVLLETLKKYHFLLLPSEGENYGHAIIESLSVGLPVIISTNTPWKNLESKKVGWDVGIKNINNLISPIKEAVAMDNATYKIWSESAIKYADSVIHDPKVLGQNQDLFKI